MEGASVLSPSSWEKRRAWARQSRCWRTTVVEEEAAAAMQDVPELQPPHLDDVFLGGSPSSKIETWLQECGSSDVPPEELGLPGPYGCGSNGTSFEDDLTLGAEALLLPGSQKTTGRALRHQHLNLGHSMASSALSSLTTKTSSSISEVLEWWQADAEEILYNLGFVQNEPGAVARVPPRFFSAPSHTRGIDFQLFLKAQVRRMEMEDPCLMLASRFQQVQALAATADAFFCLYSYVSRTPVQRISPSRLAWACPPVPDILVAPPQPAALSPVERLRKAVSTMCLYTSPQAEDSAGAASRVPPTHPSSLGQVVQEVMERAREERFRFDPTRVLEGWGGDRDAGTEGFSPKDCPHEVGAWGAGRARCSVGAEWMSPEEHPPAANVTLSSTPGPPAPQVTPEHPEGLGAKRDSGISSGSLRRSHGCHLRDPLDPAGTRAPGSDTPRAGGHWAQRSRGRRRGSPSKDDAPGLQPPSKGPSSHLQHLGDSFEMEEVLSASEEEDEEDGDAHSGAVWSLHPSVGIRRNLMLHASSGRSDSSGFVEELVLSHAAAPTRRPEATAEGPGVVQAGARAGDGVDCTI